jgi:AAA15 family ATPase/GTPase
MLIEFSFANYRSFRDLQKFSMLAAPLRSNDAGLEEGNVFEVDGLRLLKSKAIYGQNASGKSNITKALAAFHVMVSRSVSIERLPLDIWEERFGLLTGWDDEPIFFQMLFMHEKVIYRYGFQLKEGKIDSEWLFGRLNKQEVKFFKRGSEGMDISETNFKGAKAFVELSLSGEHEIFRPGSLFLTGAALMGNKQAIAIREGIARVMLVNGLEDRQAIQLSMAMLDNGKKRERDAIRKLIEVADPSIKDLKLMEIPEEILSGLPTPLQESIKSKDGSLGKMLYSFRDRYDENGILIERIPTNFDDWESAGTKKFFAISGIVLSALTLGRPLIIDEFDARFHPALTEKLIQVFHNSETNPHNAQLIFVTHDASLLSRIELRRDQICLIDKDKFGISNLHTLIEYKGVRKDASYEKDYLQGKYGAVPFLGEIDHIISSLLADDISDIE